jgi:S-DNA-T family DNA segregation ATPase FtsK/SpoIIIE
MDTYLIAGLIAGGAALGVVVWVLAKIGHALIKIAEALAAAAVVFFTLWLVIKALAWALRQTVTYWRTSLTVIGVLAWCQWWGWQSLAITASAVAALLIGWRLVDLRSFDAWAGRHLRAWWLRWTVYAPKLPEWLHACGLGIKQDAAPVVVTLTPLVRGLRRSRQHSNTQLPRVIRVRSGGSWDLVRVRLVPGQKPEDFDAAARALASARGVARCQVRELSPNVVSIDFQRRNLLADPVACPDLAALADIPGEAVDLRRVWAGRTEYGQDWHISLAGPASHLLAAGESGAGKNSVTWRPLVSIAPAIRDGLVRVSGIDPKGMELAYGRRIFARYAVTGTDALALLDDLVEAMAARKAEFAGRVRVVPITREHPLELVEFDELGALTKYTDRRTRDAITERLALLTTQGRALGSPSGDMSRNPPRTPCPSGSCFPGESACGSRPNHMWGWCSATRPTTGAPGPTASPTPKPASATSSAKASENRCGSAPAGSPTRQSSSSKPSSPPPPGKTARCWPCPPPAVDRRPEAWHESLVHRFPDPHGRRHGQPGRSD